MIVPSQFDTLRVAQTGGHAHFWERATLSRRQFLKGAAVTAAAFVGSQLISVSSVHAAGLPGSAPNPIPGGTTLGPLGLFHLFLPTDVVAPGVPKTIANNKGDPSTITDFRGVIGVGEWAGGTGRSRSNGHRHTLYWAADVRFIKGEYVGVDGHARHGAFAFL